MHTGEQVYNYLIQPSPLFIKQVLKVEETKAYIIVQDLRKKKNLHIPDKVIRDYEYCLDIFKGLACKTNEYDGVNFLIFNKF